MARYWVYLQGRVEGPFEAAQLMSLSDFNQSVLVCPESQPGTDPGDWKPARDIAELMPPAGGSPVTAGSVPQAPASPASVAGGGLPAPTQAEQGDKPSSVSKLPERTPALNSGDVEAAALLEQWNQLQQKQWQLVMDKLSALQQNIERLAEQKEEKIAQLESHLQGFNERLSQWQKQAQEVLKRHEEAMRYLESGNTAQSKTLEALVKGLTELSNLRGALETKSDRPATAAAGAPGASGPMPAAAGGATPAAAPGEMKLSPVGASSVAAEPEKKPAPKKIPTTGTSPAPAGSAPQGPQVPASPAPAGSAPQGPQVPASPAPAKMVKKSLLPMLFYGLSAAVVLFSLLWFYQWFRRSPQDNLEPPEGAVTQWENLEPKSSEQDLEGAGRHGLPGSNQDALMEEGYGAGASQEDNSPSTNGHVVVAPAPKQKGSGQKAGKKSSGAKTGAPDKTAGRKSVELPGGVSVTDLPGTSTPRD